LAMGRDRAARRRKPRLTTLHPSDRRCQQKEICADQAVARVADAANSLAQQRPLATCAPLVRHRYLLTASRVVEGRWRFMAVEASVDRLVKQMGRFLTFFNQHEATRPAG